MTQNRSGSARATGGLLHVEARDVTVGKVGAASVGELVGPVA